MRFLAILEPLTQKLLCLKMKMIHLCCKSMKSSTYQKRVTKTDFNGRKSIFSVFSFFPIHFLSKPIQNRRCSTARKKFVYVTINSTFVNQNQSIFSQKISIGNNFCPTFLHFRKNGQMFLMKVDNYVGLGSNYGLSSHVVLAHA